MRSPLPPRYGSQHSIEAPPWLAISQARHEGDAGPDFGPRRMGVGNFRPFFVAPREPPCGRSAPATENRTPAPGSLARLGDRTDHQDPSSPASHQDRTRAKRPLIFRTPARISCDRRGHTSSPDVPPCVCTQPLATKGFLARHKLAPPRSSTAGSSIRAARYLV